MARSPPSLCINVVLPHHLLVEVFIRVPSRDAFRCRSVCKLWLSCLRDDPYFISHYILHGIRKQPLNQEDQQRIFVQCNVSEVLVVNPTWNLPPDFHFSLDFLPFYAGLVQEHTTLGHVVVGSSNGLLLCSPDDFIQSVYYICNPITKQWLALPDPGEGNHPHFQVAFICDQFYSLGDDDGLVTLNHQIGFKVIRMLYGFDIEDGEVLVQMFTSHTGCWTTSTVKLPESVMPEHYLRSLVPCNGMVYCLIEPCDIFVYDPNKNEFLQECIPPPLHIMYIDSDQRSTLETLRGLSLCQGSFWIGQSCLEELRIFELVDGE